jgi:hypothetical protein
MVLSLVLVNRNRFFAAFTSIAVHVVLILLIARAPGSRLVAAEPVDHTEDILLVAIGQAETVVMPAPVLEPDVMSAPAVRAHRTIVATATRRPEVNLVAAATPPRMQEMPPPRSVGPLRAAVVPTALIAPEEARALRVYDVFPSLPEHPDLTGTDYAVQLEICVTTGGLVGGIKMNGGIPPAMEAGLRHAILTWRYRPRLVDGMAVPFCHRMLVSYERR